MELQTLIVERVEPGSAADRAGLRRGDRLHTYAGQPLTSPAMLQALEDNIPGYEPVAILGERDGQPWEWSLIPEKRDPQVRSEYPDLGVRPDLPDDVLGHYELGREAFQRKDYAEAMRLWNDLAPRVPEPIARAWVYLELGRTSRYDSFFETGLAAGMAAEELLRDGADPAAQVWAFTIISVCHILVSDLDAAQRWAELARQVDEAMGWQRWLAKDTARLGSLAQYRGDLNESKKYNSEALTICADLNPDDPFIAMILNNLGNIALIQGDLATARRHFTDGYEIWKRLNPGTTYEALGGMNLGRIAGEIGDTAGAMDYYSEALRINEQINPASHEMGSSLGNLGTVLLTLGDLEAAQEHFTRALHIWEGSGSGPVYIAHAHVNLGEVAFKQGDYDTALDRHLQALRLREALAPQAEGVALSLRFLGDTSLRLPDPSAAEGYYGRALEIYERIGPGSLENASCLAGMGYFDLSHNRPSDAVPRFQKAVEIIERYRTQIAVPEARALLMAEHHRKYAGLVQSLLAVGDIGAAFHTLERARSRSFVELLAARGLDTADAPAELLNEQQDVDRQRAQTYHQLSSLSGADKDAAQVASLHRTLRDLERRQQGLTAKIRAASPRYASLQYPQPLTLAEAQATLEPGTLLLSYLVDDDQAFLFAVTSTHAEAHTLPVGRQTLQEQVRAFRLALDRNRLAHDPAWETALGRELYALLVRPARKAMRQSERLLLCPDGPLHALPYPALVTSSRGKPKHFGAEKPLGQILSATTYAQTRAALPEAASRRLLAFGDPVYQAPPGLSDAPPDSDTRSRPRRDTLTPRDELTLLRTRGLSLAPLPHTREEVEGLARLFGDDATVLLGAEATKSAVLAESGGADLLHLACHAWFDPQIPLSSGLVLSQSGTDAGDAVSRDNGLLQAWEVLQSLRLSADLVVLSACQTGLGKEVRGEGLVGLARAFQYAGARSLVVTLWDVADESTSLFMQAFYAALKDGAAKDDALRRGVLALQADPRWDAPCYWAAFVLIGDRN